MRLSKTAYYADFAVYAAVLTVMSVIAALGPGWTHKVQWLAACVAGAAGWTLIEYLLHGFVLHGRSIFAPMHAVHHESPRAYVGTPTWITLAVFWLVVFIPAWAYGSLNVASGLTAGVMLGFLWYGVVHHVIHYRQPRVLVRWLSATARRHMYHHYSIQPGNFGVTTPLWDYVFGTVIDPTRRPIARSPARVPPAT
jgi:sterol desaturase/sphingolipid hydroxylase (fatty acid hydroxylase superfamily)